jgi:hypothetical protein
VRLRDIAAALDTTERSAYAIVSELTKPVRWSRKRTAGATANQVQRATCRCTARWVVALERARATTQPILRARDVDLATSPSVAD